MVLYKKNRNSITGLLFGLLALISIDTWLLSTAGYDAARFFAMFFLLLGLLLPIEHTFYLYIFCFPFSSVLKFSDGGISILPLLNMVMILRLLWKKQVRVSNAQLLCFFGLLAMQLLCVLFYNAGIMEVGSFFVSIFFVICSASYFSRQQDRHDIFVRATVFYAAALIAGILLCDLFPDAMYRIAKEKQTALAYNGRFGSIFVEPNEFSQAVLVGMGLLMTIFPMLSKGVYKVLTLAVLIYLGISGYRSLSKSYVLTLVGMFVVLILMNWYRTKKQKGLGNAILKILPGIVVLVAGTWVIFNQVVLPTFEERNRVDLLTGRGGIWLDYIEALMQRVDILIWGCGMGNMTKLADAVETIGSSVTHNTYLEYLSQLGILGIILLVSLFVKVIRQNTNKLTTYFVLVLAAFLITAFGISSNNNDCIFVTMLFVTMPFMQQENQKQMMQEK